MQLTIDHWEEYWGDDKSHDWWKRPASEVLEFIEQQSPEQRPDVLDLGCGLGRHAIAFAQAGFRVTATDASRTGLKHVREWADTLGLSIETRVCDILDEVLSEELFDIVLSYNVLYHGYRQDFVQAIDHVYGLLRPSGLFFFTCPTRQDGKYGHGEQVAAHTYACTKSVTPGDIHYFADEADLDELLTEFHVVSRTRDEGYWDNQGTQQFFSNWQILVEKGSTR